METSPGLFKKELVIKSKDKFMVKKHKYVRLKKYGEFIFFSELIEHSRFAHLNPISAGFCYLNDGGIVKCFGRSESLGIDSMEDDSKLATRQVYGCDTMHLFSAEKNMK
jgi:hypothetical protein